MDFTDQVLKPFGETLLDMPLKTDLGLKTALVFRVIKLLQRKGYLPPYGCHMAEVCLEEALTNAMVHGNKLDPAKQVHVTVFGDGVRFGAIIEDQGEGFTAADVPDPDDPAIAFNEHGRGIVLMTHYMDDVRYNARGNRVYMERKVQVRPDEGAHEPFVLPEPKSLPAVIDISAMDLSIPEIKPPKRAAAVVIPDEILLEGEPAAPAPAIAAAAAAPAVETDTTSAVGVHERGGVVIARIRANRLTEDNVNEVRGFLNEATARGKHVVIDLAEVDFMSSVGISTIIGAHKQAVARKRKVVLSNLSPALKNVLKATGLLKFFQIEDDQDAAIKKLQ